MSVPGRPVDSASTQAAELLGISFRQLRYRMQKLRIYEPE